MTWRLPEAGTCTLCHRRVFVRADGTEVVRVRGSSAEVHHHRRAYALTSEEDADSRDREWWWVAGGPKI